jgi:hypothetical protein
MTVKERWSVPGGVAEALEANAFAYLSRDVFCHERADVPPKGVDWE